MTASSKPLHTLAALFVVVAALHVHPARAQDVKDQLAACVACHPVSDVPANSVNPIIWGQNLGYVYLQLRDFKRGTRASESDVAMRALTQTMTDAQMLAIAKYVSAQPWPKSQDPATPPTDALFLLGAKLAAYGDCGGCHFTNWQGYGGNPRLRGQTAAYLTLTMNEFRSGERGNAPGMADLLRAYSADEIKAIAEYLSSVD
jgi:cytochrome c553